MSKEAIILTSTRTADGLDTIISDIEQLGYVVIRASTSEELDRLDLPERFSILSDRTTFLISPQVYERATGFAVNVHPSLLPLHAGSYSLFWSCVFHDPFGLTIHELAPRLDRGKIIFQSEINYSSEQTFRDVYRATRVATAAAIRVLLFAQDCRFRFSGVDSDQQRFFLHSSAETQPLLAKLPNGWDTPIMEARLILKGMTDKSGREITSEIDA